MVHMNFTVVFFVELVCYSKCFQISVCKGFINVKLFGFPFFDSSFTLENCFFIFLDFISFFLETFLLLGKKYFLYWIFFLFSTIKKQNFNLLTFWIYYFEYSRATSVVFSPLFSSTPLKIILFAFWSLSWSQAVRYSSLTPYLLVLRLCWTLCFLFSR